MRATLVFTGTKEKFEQTDYMIYCSIQLVLATKIKGRKIEDTVKEIASVYQGDLEKPICLRSYKNNNLKVSHS